MCRPREIGRPCADGPPAPDATFVAQIVLHMSNAHAADERIDRVLDGIVTRLQTSAAPRALRRTREMVAAIQRLL